MVGDKCYCFVKQTDGTQIKFIQSRRKEHSMIILLFSKLIPLYFLIKGISHSGKSSLER